MPEAPRRHYSVVDIADAQGGYAVRLDGRTPRSPAGRPLVLPTKALAQLSAEEWWAQGDTVEMAAMPATRLAFTALDAVAERHAEVSARVADFAADDLICYFAEGPASLLAEQRAIWVPLLDWAEEALGLVFRHRQGVGRLDQSPETLVAVTRLAEGLDAFTLAGLALSAQLFGSAVLALALMRGRLTGAEAHAAAALDELHQAARWGADAEAERGRVARSAEAAMLESWFRALG